MYTRKVSRRQLTMIVAAALLLGAAVIASNPRLRGLLVRGQWDALSAESNRQRHAMIEAGLLMIKEHPLFGYGAGSTPVVYPQFRSALSGGVDSVLQLHNTYVHIGAELGLVALVAMLLVGASASRASGAAILSSNPQTGRYLRAAAGSLGAYGVFAFTDFQLDVPAFAAVVALDLAVLFSLRPATNSSRRSRVAMGGAATIMLVAFAAVSWPNARARAISSDAFEALNAGDKNRFAQLSLRASETAKDDPAYLNQIAAYLIDRRAETQDAGAQASMAPQIVHLLEQSLQRQQNQEFAHFNLGWILLELGRPEALAHFTAAARLVPDKGGVYLGIGLCLLSRNDTAGAAQALSIECLNDPMFLSAPWWSTPAFTQMKPLVAARLSATAADVGQRFPLNAALAAEAAYISALAKAWSGQAGKERLDTVANSEARRGYFKAHPEVQDLLSGNAVQYRRERTGYPVLARQPHTPPPHDAYVVLENAAAAGPLRFLFPEKGWLPTYVTAELARTLPAN